MKINSAAHGAEKDEVDRNGNGGIACRARTGKRLAEEYAAAQAEAKKQLAVEQRACARLLEDNRRNCDVEARQLMADAEQRAAQQTEKTLAEAHAACERMQKAARERLPRAAQWIAEEVVKSEWLS